MRYYSKAQCRTSTLDYYEKGGTYFPTSKTMLFLLNSRAISKIKRWTAFMNACKSGHTDVVKLLLCRSFEQKY